MWAEDPRYAHDPARSMENYFGDLDQQLRDFFAGITIEEADMICREAMVPGGPCNTFRELVHDEQVADRKMILHVKDARGEDTLQLGIPAKFLKDDERDNEITPAPALGADTEYYLQELGVGQEEMAQLKADGVI